MDSVKSFQKEYWIIENSFGKETVPASYEVGKGIPIGAWLQNRDDQESHNRSYHDRKLTLRRTSGCRA